MYAVLAVRRLTRGTARRLTVSALWRIVFSHASTAPRIISCAPLPSPNRRPTCVCRVRRGRASIHTAAPPLDNTRTVRYRPDVNSFVVKITAALLFTDFEFVLRSL